MYLRYLQCLKTLFPLLFLTYTTFSNFFFHIHLFDGVRFQDSQVFFSLNVLILSSFCSSVPFVICLFPFRIIFRAHFSITNSILISCLYILFTCIRISSSFSKNTGIIKILFYGQAGEGVQNSEKVYLMSVGNIAMYGRVHDNVSSVRRIKEKRAKKEFLRLSHSTSESSQIDVPLIYRDNYLLSPYTQLRIQAFTKVYKT